MSTDTVKEKSADHTGSVVLVWAVLMVLTVLSYWFRDHGLSAEGAAAAIIIIAFVKVYLVGLSFMELRVAPAFLRNIFTYWCLGSCLFLLGLAL